MNKLLMKSYHVRPKLKLWIRSDFLCVKAITTDLYIYWCIDFLRDCWWKKQKHTICVIFWLQYLNGLFWPAETSSHRTKIFMAQFCDRKKEELGYFRSCSGWLLTCFRHSCFSAALPQHPYVAPVVQHKLIAPADSFWCCTKLSISHYVESVQTWMDLVCRDRHPWGDNSS